MKIITLLLLITVPLFAHAEFYKWRDADGNWQYTDKPPSDNAKPLVLPKTMLYTPATETEEAVATDDDEEAPPKNIYQALQIQSPQNDESVRDNQGNVPLTLFVEPELAEGDRFQLLIDGIPAGTPLTEKAITLQGINRGRHELQAQVVNAKGQVLIESNNVVFHMRRETVLLPKKPEPQTPVPAEQSESPANADQP